MFQNINHEKKVIILMIPNGEGWHYLINKKLPGLITRITSKPHGDFYCLICLHSFAKENKPESHQKSIKQRFL